jgi:hypothetical protein
MLTGAGPAVGLSATPSPDWRPVATKFDVPHGPTRSRDGGVATSLIGRGAVDLEVPIQALSAPGWKAATVSAAARARGEAARHEP